MNRTRIIFFVIIAVAIAIVAIGLIARSLDASANPIAPAQSNEPIEVRVVTALPIEPWVTEAANQYNAEKHTLDGRPVKVTIVPMDGLTALNRFDSASFDKCRRRGFLIRAIWWSWRMPPTKNAMAAMCS